jgi:hypothetical protein
VMRRTLKCIGFIDNKSCSREAYTLIMNYRREIPVALWSELSELDSADQQIHVYLLSRLVDHQIQYFLHSWARKHILYRCNNLIEPIA